MLANPPVSVRPAASLKNALRRGCRAGALILVIGGCSKDTDHVANGNRLAADNKPREAVVEFRNALRDEPRSAAAHKGLAEAYEKLGEVENARRAWIRAADAMPDDTASQIKAANGLLSSGQFTDALSRADKALANDPKNVEALVVRAYALAGLKRLDAALEEAEEAVQVDPSRAASLSTLGSLRAFSGDLEKAEAAFKQAVAVNPASTDARIALAGFYWSSSRPELAEQQLSEALRLDPRHPGALRALSGLYVWSGRVADAEPHLKTLSDVLPESTGKLLLADYYVATKRIPDARALLTALRKDVPRLFNDATLRMATLAAREGDSAEAERLVEELLAKRPNLVNALALRAELLLQKDDVDGALRDARQAVNGEANSAAAQFMLGRVQRRLGAYDDAITSFTAAANLNSQLVTADLQVAQLQLARRRLDAAEAAANRALQKVPGWGEARLLLAQVYFARNDLGRAEPLVAAVAKEFPKWYAAQREAGRLLAAKRNPAAAYQALESAYALNPQDPETIALLVGLDVEAKRPEAARKRVQSALAAPAPSVGILLVAARTYAGLGDAAEAERLLQRAATLDRRDGEAHFALGHLYASQKKTDLALQHYRTAAERQPNTVAPYAYIGEILGSENRRAEAKEAYRRALEIDPEAAVVANNLAWMYAEDGERLQEALQLAQRARARFPESPDIASTLGWVHYKMGGHSQAIIALNDAVRLDPNNATAQYHLGFACAKTGDVPCVRRALGAALKLAPMAREATEARGLLAQFGA
jgi:tetratricopeptide (TPR) repeat protein